MPRVKRYIQTGFTTVNNEYLRDVNLSLTDRGLLTTMLSLPDGWNITGKSLASILPDGTSKIYASLARLKEHGYLKTERIRENGEFRDMLYLFCDVPVFKKENKEEKEKKEAMKNGTQIEGFAEKEPVKKKKTSKKPAAKKDEVNIILVPPKEKTEEEAAETEEKFNTLTGEKLKKYIAEEVLEKEKVIKGKFASEADFNKVVDVFVNVIKKEPEQRKPLSYACRLDAINLANELKRVANPDKELRRILVEDGVFMKR